MHAVTSTDWVAPPLHPKSNTVMYCHLHLFLIIKIIQTEQNCAHAFHCHSNLMIYNLVCSNSYIFKQLVLCSVFTAFHLILLFLLPAVPRIKVDKLITDAVDTVRGNAKSQTAELTATFKQNYLMIEKGHGECCWPELKNSCRCF